MPEKFYVTTPIYYVNARPHIGHAYTTIVADVLARRHRLLGDDTYFLTGTDEHGQKIERSAAAAGIAPQAFADEVSESFRTLWKRMGMTNDAYIRTTDEAHKLGVQKLFRTLYERGQIYLSSYTGQYCVSEEMFVEGPPGTIGPDGRPTETVTEENFFFRLSDFQLPLLDLIESDTLCITPDSRKNEVLSFLRGADAYNDAATAERGTTAQGKPYVAGALKDLSISRSSFTWGIPVPEPAASQAKEKHVIYVWLDALANYMTALGYGSGDETKFERYWPANLHLVGKEIIRFHCVYWPAFLLALNPKLQRREGEAAPVVSTAEHAEWAAKWLPKAVTAHGWLLFDDSKMSKSKGNIVRTETILEAFGGLCPAQVTRECTKEERDLFAADVLRYFLLREIPFGQDGSFTFDALVTRYNADLANGYGNLVSRTLAMIAKYEDGEVNPESRKDTGEYLGVGAWARGGGESHFDTFRFSTILDNCMVDVKAVDTMLSERKPWKCDLSVESERDSVRNTLYMAAESIRIITAILYPFLPFATANVWRQLGLGDIEEAARNGELRDLEWGGLKGGTRVGSLSPIFPRADKGLAQTMSDMEQTQDAQKAAKPTPSTFVDENFAASPATHPDPTHPSAPPRTGTLSEPNPGLQVGGSSAIMTERAGTPAHTEAHPSGIFTAGGPASGPPDASPQINIDDFAKVELRVAKILVAERIPKADKLLRLEVDLGYEKRQILSGIAEWYTPEDLIGRRIVVITNLAPRKMRGLESHGMLLAASAPEGGKPSLTTFPDADDLPLGARLK